MIDNFFNSAFDFFSHALPGFCIIAGVFMLDGEVHSLEDLLEVAHGINTGGGIFLLLIGYILGQAIYPIGRWLYKGLGFKIWNMKIHNNLSMPISERYILVRELSPANFKYIETWNLFCAMSHNLAVASLVLIAISIIKFAITQSMLWLGFAVLLTPLFFLFLYRAVVFSVWAAHDINAAIEKLNMVERAKNLPEPK